LFRSRRRPAGQARVGCTEKAGDGLSRQMAVGNLGCDRTRLTVHRLFFCHSGNRFRGSPETDGLRAGNARRQRKVGMQNVFLEALPLKDIAKYFGGQPKNAVPFAGYPRQHPSEKNKLILVYDPLGAQPTIMEFKFDDVLSVEEVPSVVTEAGEGIPLIRLWVRRGAHGVILEPFEVGSPMKFANKSMEVRERFMNAGAPGPGSGSAEGTGSENRAFM